LFLVIAAMLNGQPQRPAPPPGVIFICFSLLGSVAYHTICEGVHGSTIGKRLLGIVVVQEDGNPCRLKPALIRSLAYYIDSLFFGVIGYMAMNKTPQEQRHGDDWAHTVVCRRSDVAQHTLRSGGQFARALLFAAMVDSAFIITGLLLSGRADIN
jgi:uncharacterized RDD family membrane protein YckC